MRGSIEIINKQAVWPRGSDDTVCLRPPLTLTFDPFDLETGMRVASKAGNLPLGSRIIRYVRDERTDTDGRTDKSNAYFPLPYGRGHNNNTKQITKTN